MMRRWVIRSMLILLLAMCVTAWVGSYWALGISHYGRTWDGVLLEDGRIGIVQFNSIFNFNGVPGWDWGKHRGVMDWTIWDKNRDTYAALKFSYSSSVIHWGVTFPLWFPTLLAALLLWFIWRKTKAKPIGGAFPVEPTKAGEKQP